MADKPCSTCQHYDPIMRGDKEGRHGRCAAKSTYPAAEQSGQTFPPGVTREQPGDLAKPVIVTGAGIERGCLQYRSKPISKNKPIVKVKPRK